MKYRREIDGLRALAVVPVILFHAGFKAFSGGFVGVDVFFVISGYLITSIIYSELVVGRFSIANFYERRARRILPPLFFVMLVCLPLAWLWLLPTEMKNFAQSLIAVCLFFSNILFWQGSGYFDTAAETKPLLHTWSLAVEEQYYLLFPLFLMMSWRLGRRWLICALSGLAIISLALAQWASTAHPTAGFFLLPMRGWELLMGALAAIYLAHPNQRPRVSQTTREVSGGFGLLCILVSIFAYSSSTPFPSLYALVPTVGAVLIILCATEQTIVGRFLGHRFFVGLGLLSYSAYLWHQPLFAFLKQSYVSENQLSYLVLIVMTWILAYLSWRFIEGPFRDRQNFSRSQIFAGSAASMLVFIVFGYLGIKSNGFENRASVAPFKDLAYDSSALGYTSCDQELMFKELMFKEPTLNYCLGSPGAPTALIIGDSHAEDKLHGIAQFSQQYQWRLVGNTSCPPVLGVRVRGADKIECVERLKKIFSYIASEKSIELVVLAFSHSYPLDTLIAADHVQKHFQASDNIVEDLHNPALSKVEAFYLGLGRAIEFLKQQNIQTIVLLDVPELTFFPRDCLRGKVSCEFERNSVLKRQEIMRTNLSLLSQNESRLRVFDPLDVFCAKDNCSMMKNGRPLYRDSHHLTHFGSLNYGEAFSSWLLKDGH